MLIENQSGAVDFVHQSESTAAAPDSGSEFESEIKESESDVAFIGWQTLASEVHALAATS
jgi:hypothetical protein